MEVDGISSGSETPSSTPTPGGSSPSSPNSKQAPYIAINNSKSTPTK